MNRREILINELDSASDNILDEVIDFVQFLKYKKTQKSTNPQLNSLGSISKYKGIAKGVWNKDGQDVVNEMREDDR
jgi:hypothetical protein